MVQMPPEPRPQDICDAIQRLRWAMERQWKIVPDDKSVGPSDTITDKPVQP
jgi:hypothetical protein